MKCIKTMKQTQVGKKKAAVIERVSNEQAHRLVSEGKATYVAKSIWKQFLATGEVK